jgi:ATP-dependent helicase/nuclease subunit B
LRQAIDARTRDPHAPLSAIEAEKLTRIVGALERVTESMAGWTERVPPVERLRALVTAAEALAATSEETGVQRLWRDGAGEALSDFVHDALQSFTGLPGRGGGGFHCADAGATVGRRGAAAFRQASAPRHLGPAGSAAAAGRPPGAGQPQRSDLAGGECDRSVAEPARCARASACPAPERKIGLSAHDFQQAMGAPKVLLTRAERVDGAPTVPSRWLLRLDAFLTCAAEGLPSNAGALERRLAHVIDRPAQVEPGKRPMPRPGAARRPQQLSVTQIEAWRRNPYAIYARHILRLKALDPLDQDPGAADLGEAVHKALHEFTRRFPHALPTDAVALLNAEGQAAFQAWLDRPNVWAFWQPRFQRIAAWWISHERKRRTPLMTSISTEIHGVLELAEISPTFQLTARADRIDTFRDGSLTIIDYKTGQPPTKTEVERGFAPQLALEAVMALDGSFKEVAGQSIGELAYWKLSGSRGGGEDLPVNLDPMQLADEARTGLTALIDLFGRDDAVYLATPDPQFAPKYDDYEHLARNSEWLSEREQWP